MNPAELPDIFRLTAVGCRRGAPGPQRSEDRTLRESIWAAQLDEPHPPLYGWRFQATDDAGETFVFDVYRDKDGWHVHRLYA